MNFNIIHIIQKSEIAIWLKSESFKNYEFIPLSPLRAESYINNPHANPDDPLVFMVMKEDQVIAFRTVLPDKRYLKDGQTIRFAWLSGSWVHPNYRRKGYSTHLLKEVEKHWQGRLMYTNYAPASKKLYDKTGNFASVAEFSGIRYFSKEGFLEKVYSKWPILEKLPFLTGLISTSLKAMFFLSKGKKKITFGHPDLRPASWNELEGFIQNKAECSLRRKKTDFEWILSYPWADQSDEAKIDASRYPFSCWSSDFFSKPLIIQNEKSSATPPLIWPIIKNGDLKLTYCSYRDEQLPLIVEALLMLSQKHQLKTLTIWDEKINTELQQHEHPFAFPKEQNQLVLANKRLIESINEELKIDFGDGDVVFV